MVSLSKHELYALKFLTLRQACCEPVEQLMANGFRPRVITQLDLRWICIQEEGPLFSVRMYFVRSLSCLSFSGNLGINDPGETD